MPYGANQPFTHDLPPLPDDRDFRNEVVEDTLAAARTAGILPGARIERLLERYIEGAITFDELQREVMRPFVH